MYTSNYPTGTYPVVLHEVEATNANYSEPSDFTEWSIIRLFGRYTKDTQIIIFTYRVQGAVSIRKTVLPGMAIPMLKIRRPNGRLIFNMEIAIRR